jgi:hypothetical protein
VHAGGDVICSAQLARVTATVATSMGADKVGDGIRTGSATDDERTYPV